jgi:hypothetical protein
VRLIKRPSQMNIVLSFFQISQRQLDNCFSPDM